MPFPFDRTLNLGGLYLNLDHVLYIDTITGILKLVNGDTQPLSKESCEAIKREAEEQGVKRAY